MECIHDHGINNTSMNILEYLKVLKEHCRTQLMTSYERIYSMINLTMGILIYDVFVDR